MPASDPEPTTERTPAELTRQRLEELAYKQGRRDADVDARLLSHERRLNAINGSIEKHARNADKLTAAIGEVREALDTKLDTLIAAQAARAAVEADRESRATQSADRVFKRRTLLIGFWTVVVMLAGVLGTAVGLLLTVH